MTRVASGAPFAAKSGTRSCSVDGSRTAPDSWWAPPSRAFSRTAIDRGAACGDAFCSCASRRAAESPAGPPPTIRISTSRTSRVTTGRISRKEQGDRTQKRGERKGTHETLRVSTSVLLQLRRDGWCKFEQVADDPVVCHFEDRGIRIFVDRHDRPAALHADQMLNRTRNAERNVELGRDGLPGAADLTFHRQPAAVADRSRCG